MARYAHVALALLTKQVVCALAIVPIGLAELTRARREGLGGPARRLSLAMGLPSIAAITWAAMLARVQSSNVGAMLWKHAVVDRVRGYESGQHHNYLNRAVEVLTRDAPPASWRAGLFGFFVLLVWRAGDTRRTHDAWLLGGMFGTAWLAFDVGSRSLLPWYVLTFLPAVALGYGFTLCRAGRLIERWKEASRLEVLAGVVGVWALAELAVNASQRFAPSILVLAVVAFGVLWIVVRPERGKGVGLALVAGVCALTGYSTYKKDAYHHTESYNVATLAPLLHQAGARRVSVDTRLKLGRLTLTTFFGPLAQASAAPWSLPRQTFDTRVEQVVVPREFEPRSGVKLLRAPGLSAVVARDLTTSPFAEGVIDALLSRGPLTFEAEDLASDRYDTLRAQPEASGQAARKTEWDTSVKGAPRTVTLAHGSTPELPKGAYQARFYLRAECGTNPRERVARVSVEGLGAGGQRRPVICKDVSKGRAFVPVSVFFEQKQPRSVRLVVREVVSNVALDRVTLERTTP